MQEDESHSLRVTWDSERPPTCCSFGCRPAARMRLALLGTHDRLVLLSCNSRNAGRVPAVAVRHHVSGTEFHLPGRTALQRRQCHSVPVLSYHGAVNRNLQPKRRYSLGDRMCVPAGSVLKLLSCTKHSRALGYFPPRPPLKERWTGSHGLFLRRAGSCPEEGGQKQRGPWGQRSGRRSGEQAHGCAQR